MLPIRYKCLVLDDAFRWSQRVSVVGTPFSGKNYTTIKPRTPPLYRLVIPAHSATRCCPPPLAGYSYSAVEISQTVVTDIARHLPPNTNICFRRVCSRCKIFPFFFVLLGKINQPDTCQ